MPKFAAFFRKRADIGHADFQRYWLTTHAGVVRRLPGLIRYVQNHPLPGTLLVTSPFHGVAEVWLESAAALERDPAAPYWREVAEDEARFIDPASLTVLPVEERVLKDGAWPRPGIKVLRTLARMDGRAPPVAVLPAVARYARNAGSGDSGAFCAGYDAAWFAGPAEANATAAAMRDPAALQVMVVAEHVILA
jgi:uncharacterized protein (TIGR02118 family)